MADVVVIGVTTVEYDGVGYEVKVTNEIGRGAVKSGKLVMIFKVWW